ncbi:hypothetical protein [Thermacetogenium phaeum]|uniref:hypothetical protein n=1 Tax=Thermacetogenium phaeum TaxID=85874 RepID=UPI00130E5EA2|nr:hypothetical protein [Thermacetogenium phaeum]
MMKNRNNLFITIFVILFSAVVLVTLGFDFQRLVESGRVVSPELAVVIINVVIFSMVPVCFACYVKEAVFAGKTGEIRKDPGALYREFAGARPGDEGSEA